MTSIFRSIRHGMLMALAVVWVYLTFFYRGTLTVLLIILALVFVPSLLRAEANYPPEWDEAYPINASELELFDAFDIFSRSYRVGIMLDRDIENEDLRAMRRALSAAEYLDDITGQVSLGWYFDGSVVRVYPIGKVETRVLPVKTERAAKIMNTLKELEIYQPQFTHRIGRQTQTLRVTAPPSYIDMVASTLEAIELSRQVDVRVRRAGVVVDYNDIPQDRIVGAQAEAGADSPAETEPDAEPATN